MALYLYNPNGTWTTLDPITEFDSNGHFSQALNLQGYGLGNYGIWGEVFDHQGLKGERFWTTFNLTNQAPDSLTLELDSDNYHPSQTLTLSGIANDADGSHDLEKVDFYLQLPNQTWMNLSDVETFADNGDFSYQLDLDNYGLGNYNIWGRAQDYQGTFSAWIKQSFSVQNQAPSNLNLSLNSNTYQTDDLINIEGTLTDMDGFDDLLKVEMWLRQPNNVWIDIPDITLFEQEGNNIGSFNYDLNLNDAMAGDYLLWARGQDTIGVTSNAVQQSFAVG